MIGGVTKVSGLEGLEDQSLKNLFTGMFRKGSLQEIEDLFAAGTSATTPSPEEVGVAWPSPWIFLRLLILSLLAAGGFFWALVRFDNLNLYPGWLMTGAIAVPFSVLIFFFEVNVARNVSLTRVILLFIGGGLISMIASLFLFEATGLLTWFGVMAAGPIEELGKVLALVFFAHHWKHLHWSINGMLMGAAVGAGFSAFETVGYTLRFDAGGYSGTSIQVERAFLSPFAHVIWTAATGAALWRVMGKKAFAFSMLLDSRFLRVFLFVVGLHALWNSPLVVPLVGTPWEYYLKGLILGIVGWVLILLLIQDGLKQLNAGVQDEVA